MADLLTQDGGIAVLEQGTCLGGGALQHFGINSNTSANGFTKFTTVKKAVAKSEPPKDDDEAIDSEREEPAAGQPAPPVPAAAKLFPSFEDLAKTDLYKELKKYGSGIVPLSLVGAYLNTAGNHFL